VYKEQIFINYFYLDAEKKIEVATSVKIVVQPSTQSLHASIPAFIQDTVRLRQENVRLFPDPHH
jgi:hypothetical protein